MRKFYKYIILFFVIIAVLDCGFGYLCRYLNSHAKGGDTKNHYYIASEMTDSILIFGSSRALHHYNPTIFEDSLGKTVYNCGLDGNGIVYNYGRLLTIINRYKPKMIIYDVIPSFDMSEDDYSKYLQWLKRWYYIPGVAEIFHDVNALEDIKMLSNFYRYNGSFIQMVSDYIKPIPQISYKGYKPLQGKINYSNTESDSEPVEWSDLKLQYFQEFVDICKENNIYLVISYSPWFKMTDSHLFQEFTKFANDNNLRVIDLFNDYEISQNPLYFEDAAHLNSMGADIFSSKFVNILKASYPL